MIKIKKFTFNGFQENTYILYDETLECIIIDPGNNNEEEDAQLVDFIEQEKLVPVKVVLTHAHLDHVFGLSFMEEKYQLKAILHKGELIVLQNAAAVASMYGVSFRGKPKAGSFISEEETLTFGNQSLKILFTPGHSPASICFYCAEQHFLIGGDVLFYQSIGRTDLPGGDFDTLINSIKSQLFVLPDETLVYAGHGPETTIGFEKISNPFID